MHGRPVQQRFHGFYIPASYNDYAAKAPDPDTVDVRDANKTLLGIVTRSTTANEGTR